MAKSAEGHRVRLEGDHGVEGLHLVAASVEDGFNRPTRGSLEFVTKDKALAMDKIVGRRVRIVMDTPDGKTRVFPGTCVSLQFLGTPSGNAHFRAEFRSWMWFLTRTTNCKVYQDQSAVQIFEQVLEDTGYSGEFRKELSGTYPVREYTIQYRESDLDFVSRLLEEEGIHYFFTVLGGKDVLVLADSVAAYSPFEGDATVKYYDVSDDNRHQVDHVHDWVKGAYVTSGKYTLVDYDFKNPRADLEVSSSKPKGRHAQTSYEFYDYPGHYRDASDGERLARVKMEAEAIRHKTAHAVGNLSNVAVGRTFTLDNHPRKEENAEYVVTRVTHKFLLTGGANPPLGVTRPAADGLEHGDLGTDPYRVAFEAIPKQEQYRPAQVTPWPRISGVQTAVVVGPSGNEIYTDEHGRIRIQFHWDREGTSDDKSSCWVRCMMPWTGKAWGMVHIPRIGQEVVVDFEDGNPDRPLVIGMMYNADTMPPFGLPGSQNISGVKSNSTKGGGGFHELIFDDTKGEELVRFQSEKDYRQIVKNNAEITIGLEKTDPGDLTQTVHNDKTETIGGKLTQTVTGDTTQTVKEGDYTQTIAQGDFKQTVSQGNVTREVKSGNEQHTLDMGNYSLAAGLGKLAFEAMQEIKLTVGGSSITINQSGVEIVGAMNVKVSAPSVEVAGFTSVRVTSMMINLN